MSYNTEFYYLESTQKVLMYVQQMNLWGLNVTI